VKKFIRVGVDLARIIFKSTRWRAKMAPLTRKLTRVKMREFFSQIEPGLVGMEACGSAHYWARELKAMDTKCC